MHSRPPTRLDSVEFSAKLRFRAKPNGGRDENCNDQPSVERRKPCPIGLDELDRCRDLDPSRAYLPQDRPDVVRSVPSAWFDGGTVRCPRASWPPSWLLATRACRS